MSFIKQLEPAYISFYVTFNQVKEVARKMISDCIDKEISISVEAEDFNNSLKVLLNFDDSSLSDDEVGILGSSGFYADEPYNNGDIVLGEMFAGISEYEVQPLTGEDEEWGTYFVVQISYTDYKSFVE
ncbi:hypothetical protein [Peribacillus sp. SCS-155]|uniref:hypothetical protein n=1 Tax=Peribacillus sedimenti TaxID=3115297 RepID=UPI0039062336